MICKDCIHNAVCKYGEARSNGLYCTGEKCKQYLSSADVVPKSEVAEIIEEAFKMMQDNFVNTPIYKVFPSDLKAELIKKYTEEKENEM